MIFVPVLLISWLSRIFVDPVSSGSEALPDESSQFFRNGLMDIISASESILKDSDCFFISKQKNIRVL